MNFSCQRFLGFVTLPALALLVIGCASPGPPRPPSLHLPQRLTQVRAERHGSVVTLHFATPARSSDDQLLTDPVFANLCRAVADGPCQPTASFPGKVQVSGPVEWNDALPPELASGPDRLLTYRVELFTPRGRSAGPSEPAYAAAGRAPRSVEGLKAEGSREGIVLRWEPEPGINGELLLAREDLKAPAPKPSRAARQVRPLGHKTRTPVAVPIAPGSGTNASAVTWLHAEHAGAGDPGGMIDNTAHSAEPYRYTAVRSRKVSLQGKQLELRSDPSGAVAIKLEDIFPPAVPAGLQAASFAASADAAPAADLVWSPGTESDLAGYNVYRQAADAGGKYGERQKLTANPVALPAFHDATIARGVGYRYTVTAVDRKGNESAASAPADLEPMP